MAAAPRPRAGALVTGAGRGLGLEIARVLARRGHAVHVTDVDGDAASEAARSLGPPAFASAIDVRDVEACRAAAAATVDRAGALDVWVNNAGVLRTGPTWAHDDETRQLILDVNATGTINGTLAALAVMRAAGRGHIVNVISLAGITAAPGEGVYAASKHAALAFSVSTWFDLRRNGIDTIPISCLCPDGIWTPMLHDRLDDPEAAASFTGRLLQPSEVAERVDRLLDSPRPVVAYPRWRGALLRTLALFPRAAPHAVGPTLALGRLGQRRVKRRIAAGRWP